MNITISHPIIFNIRSQYRLPIRKGETGDTMGDSNILEVREIRKTYPGVVALDNVSFALRKGEIHALVGENGAGKSTLIKTIAGAITPDSGAIVVDGVSHDQMNPKLSKELGIEIIYQEFNLFPALTVAENIFLTEVRTNGFLVNKKEFREKTKQIFDEMNISIDPDAYVADISNAQKQLVEIVKAIAKESTRILVLDEPTAALTLSEVDILFESIARLRRRGVSMIYISHRLEEVFEITDRVTVLRDGSTISTLNTADTDKNELVRLMVGRELSTDYPERTTPIEGSVVMEVEHLSASGVKDVSFQLRKSEILGLAGLVGAGRTETMRAVFGADRKKGGTVRLNGQPVKFHSPSDAMQHGMGLIPEDRKQQGVILGMPICSNITLSVEKQLSRFGVVNTAKEKEVATKYYQDLRIKAPSVNQIVGYLSGGNQQKVAIAKSLAAGLDILIMDEPTRGIDVGAKREIYNLMRDLTAQGMSIIMISSEMEELLGMSDRVIVLHEGESVAELSRESFTQERVLAYASGSTTEVS